AASGGGGEGAVALDLQPVLAGGDAGRAPSLPVGPRVHGAGDVGDGADPVLGEVGERLPHPVLEVRGHRVEPGHAAVQDHHRDALGEMVQGRVGEPGAGQHDPVDDADGALEAGAFADLVLDGVQQEQQEVLLVGGLLHPGDELGEVRVGEVGDLD